MNILFIQALARELLLQVRYAEGDDRGGGSRVLLIFGDVLRVEVALRVPDLLVLEVIALEILAGEADRGHALHSED